MALEGEFKIVYNLKRIHRIMEKYNIVCPHQKVNPYRRMPKTTKEHKVSPNLLNRDLKQSAPGKVLPTYYIKIDARRLICRSLKIHLFIQIKV